MTLTAGMIAKQQQCARSMVLNEWSRRRTFIQEHFSLHDLTEASGGRLGMGVAHYWHLMCERDAAKYSPIQVTKSPPQRIIWLQMLSVQDEKLPRVLVMMVHGQYLL